MTKSDVIEIFRTSILPGIKKSEKKLGSKDIFMRRSCWNELVEILVRDRVISKQKADKWENPFV